MPNIEYIPGKAQRNEISTKAVLVGQKKSETTHRKHKKQFIKTKTFTNKKNYTTEGTWNMMTNNKLELKLLENSRGRYIQ